MKMKKVSSIGLICILMFVLCFGVADANEYWSQEANANYDLGFSGFMAYGSNYDNPNDNLTADNYTLCSISKSDYTPIAGDFGQTGTLKIVVTNLATDTLTIYNSDCSLFDEISVGTNIMAMPVLLNPKDLYSQKIVVLTSSVLRTYWYNPVVGSFELSSSVSLGAYSTDPFYLLTCLDEYTDSSRNPKCWVMDYNGVALSVQILIFDMVENTFSVVNNVPDDAFIFDYTGYNGLTSFRNPVTDYDFYIPFGFYKSDHGSLRGDMYNETGGNLFSYNGSYYGVAVASEYLDASDFVAKLGNNYRLFSYRYIGTTTNNYYSSVFINDLGGSTLLTVGVNMTGGTPFNMNNVSHKRLSNWAVADYDKDGSNEACFLVNNDDDEIWLQCYEASLDQSNGDIRVNYTGIMNNLSNFVLADFIPSKSVLGVATQEGIFYPTEKNYSTGKTIGIDDLGFIITIFKDAVVDAPIYVYTDDDEGYIVYPEIDLDTCGNGDCEYWESMIEWHPYYCPADCYQDEPVGEYSVGSPCETDDDCDANLKCEYGVCTLLTGGAECSSNAECLSGSCVNGKCVKASWWDSLEASKNQQFGDDTNTNNFLALFFIIAIAGFLGYYGNIWAGVGAFYILGIFFTIVGWLSIFILFGFILTGVIALVFGFMLKQS